MSSSPSPSSARPASFAALYEAAAHWARTDGLVWIYLFKSLAACFLALGIAMKLDLPQPRTAMTTVFIVMQPQSGAVFAKSFYRICGTLVGLVVMLALIGPFAQQPELFLVTTAIWVGICTAGAARNRNFRSYGFVLAGYTAALIGIPASQHPDGAFLSALTRVAEVVIGIICAGAVSGLVFPQFAGLQMRGTVRARFSAFVEYVSASLAGRNDRAQIEATNARFVADIVGFEAARSIAVFEGPDSRMRGGRLARLNSEFMTASTRFHALHQLMNRLRDSGTHGAAIAIAALEPYFNQIAPLLAKSGEPVLSAADAAHAAAQLDTYRSELPKRVRATRGELETYPDAPLLDFDTGAELLYRFIDDLHAYAATYASLAVDTHARERWIERYEPKTNAIAAGVAGLRAAIVMMVLGAFWIATAWPSGSTLTLDAAAVCALASASPDPKRTAFQMAGGTVLATLMGMIAVFGVYPHIDGFVMLCVALTPFLLLGVLMTTRPTLAGYGVGYCIFLLLPRRPRQRGSLRPERVHERRARAGAVDAGVVDRVRGAAAAVDAVAAQPPARRPAPPGGAGRPRGSGTRALAFRKRRARSDVPDQRAVAERARNEARHAALAVFGVGGRQRGDRPAPRNRDAAQRAALPQSGTVARRAARAARCARGAVRAAAAAALRARARGDRRCDRASAAANGRLHAIA
ncbi:putative membrane protein YccC [Paraburkholderia sp. UCT70]